MAKATKKQCRNLRFRILRNIHYNVARRAHYAFWNRALNFVVILGGAAALTDLVTQNSAWRYVANFAVTVAGTVQLVFDCAGGVRIHETLQQEYSKVLSKFEALQSPTSSDIAKLMATMIDVGAIKSGDKVYH